MNKTINIGIEHGCPLFDPQVNRRSPSTAADHTDVPIGTTWAHP
jgi:hypothetical protein